MEDKREQLGKPVWERLEEGRPVNLEGCILGEHTWVAFFFQSGCLAYWECSGCQIKDRDIRHFTERLDRINGWIQNPPRLVARGPRPPASQRRWVTAERGLLIEGDPSSIHFIGLEIPGLVEAHSYVKVDPSGEIEQTYEPIREQPMPYTDHYWLTRYQVIGSELVRYESHCFEESTYETPFAGEPKKTVILEGLRPSSS